MRYGTVTKEIGETPLQALERFRTAHNIASDVPLTYAGRLDPMAEGKLLVLIGDECKKRAKYDGLDKEYEFEVLAGFSSDTGDVLGLPFAHERGAKKIPDERALKKLARSFIGAQTFPYPAFSSKTVEGKPLFQHALEGTISDIEVPTARVRIYRMEYLGQERISRTELIERVIAKIELLKAPLDPSRLGSDFRKEEVIARWKGLMNRDREETVLRFRAIVSSGTYIRTLAPLIAARLGTSGLAYSIRRTNIGRYQSLLGFWTRRFHSAL